MKSKTVVIVVLVALAIGAGYMGYRAYDKAKKATE